MESITITIDIATIVAIIGILIGAIIFGWCILQCLLDNGWKSGIPAFRCPKCKYWDYIYRDGFHFCRKCGIKTTRTHGSKQKWIVIGE